MKQVKPEDVLKDLARLSSKQKQDVKAALECWATDSLMPDDIDDQSISSALGLYVVYGYPQAVQVIERAMEAENVRKSK